jgi:DNA mismatch repair protein MutL
LADLIHLLPESVANQIAAGEVVQRPASVVKELLENSIDAGARTIKLLIKEAGKTLIQVVDDGCGMSETDARMCFERHATSKIFKAEDLFNIRTFGFRGEALASIASVSSVELKTKRKEDEMGTQIVIDGSDLKVHAPCACPEGTSLTVKNLFFNIPVRKNFLKSDSIEFKHILDTFIWVAMANPGIKFVLTNDRSEVYHLNTGSLRQRIIGIFGKKHDNIIVPVEEDTPIVKIRGFIGKPDQAKKTKGEQYLFVNKRFIRNAYFNHAIISAYENLLPGETFPFYALFLDIPSEKIDVNVHPTKTEVKFEDEKAIYLFLRTAIRKSLSQHHVAPSLDFEQEAFNNSVLGPGSSKTDQNSLRIGMGGRDSFTASPFNTRISGKSPEKDWEELYEVLRQKAPEIIPGREASPVTEDILFSDTEAVVQDEQSTHKILQLHSKYILATLHSGIMIVHQQYAHQRILFEDFLQKLKNRVSASQKQLFPDAIELSQHDLPVFTEMIPDLEAIGFTLEPFGKKAFLISGVPVDLPVEHPKEFIEKLLEEYKNNLGNKSADKKEALAAAMAAQSAVKTGQALTSEEMSLIIDKLFACSNPYFTPSGKAVLLKIDVSELDRKFS